MKQKCTCVYATAENTEAVRKGYEMGGYVKEFCPMHAAEAAEAPNTSSGESDGLHAAIMNIPCHPYRDGEEFVIGYKFGHRDARHAAAELVAALAAQPAPAASQAASHSAPEPVARWIRVEDDFPKMYERVLVLTTDAEDDPHHALAHYNGSVGFLGIGGHRLNPVTHWQSLDQPPADWKLPPPKPRNPKRRTATKGNR